MGRREEQRRGCGDWRTRVTQVASRRIAFGRAFGREAVIEDTNRRRCRGILGTAGIHAGRGRTIPGAIQIGGDSVSVRSVDAFLFALGLHAVVAGGHARVGEADGALAGGFAGCVAMLLPASADGRQQQVLVTVRSPRAGDASKAVLVGFAGFDLAAAVIAQAGGARLIAHLESAVTNLISRTKTGALNCALVAKAIEVVLESRALRRVGLITSFHASVVIAANDAVEVILSVWQFRVRLANVVAVCRGTTSTCRICHRDDASASTTFIRALGTNARNERVELGGQVWELLIAVVLALRVSLSTTSQAALIGIEIRVRLHVHALVFTLVLEARVARGRDTRETKFAIGAGATACSTGSASRTTGSASRSTGSASRSTRFFTARSTGSASRSTRFFTARSTGFNSS